jgi:DNA-binding Lrp family transcriptional regulator
MVHAYIMVKANTGQADRVRDEILSVNGVVSCHIVAGDVDFITKVDVGTPADVKNVVADAILGIDGVEDTQTYIAMD